MDTQNPKSESSLPTQPNPPVVQKEIPNIHLDDRLVIEDKTSVENEVSDLEKKNKIIFIVGSICLALVVMGVFWVVYTWNSIIV